MSETATDEHDGWWRRDPAGFLSDRFGRLVDAGIADPPAAAQAIWAMAKLAGLPDPEAIVADAVDDYLRSTDGHPAPAPEGRAG
jgi:hypothetical protein